MVTSIRKIGRSAQKTETTLLLELVNNLRNELKSLNAKIELKLKEMMEMKREVDELETRKLKVLYTLPKIQAIKE